MRTIAFVAAALAASPALAATGPFFSLRNTDFVVLLAFLVFVGVLAYFRVPKLLAGMLDKRAEGIRSELEAARALREEAEEVLAEFERKRREVAAEADRIVEHAKEEARLAAEQAKEEIAASVARRLRAAEDQIASAEAKAVREVRDSAIEVAVSAARSIIAAGMTDAHDGSLVDEAIRTVESRLR